MLNDCSASEIWQNLNYSFYWLIQKYNQHLWQQREKILNFKLRNHQYVWSIYVPQSHVTDSRSKLANILSCWSFSNESK